MSKPTPEEVENKWADKIFTPTGRTIKETKDEVNELWREQQKLESLNEQKLYKELRKKQQAFRNNLRIQPNKNNEEKVPIDGDVVQGSRLFMMHCADCHSLEVQTEKQAVQSNGPSLAMVYMKPCASRSYERYSGYSESLLNANIVWNSWNLYLWMKNPQEMVKGTLCLYRRKGVDSEEDRADLIKFLKVFSKNMLDYTRKSASREVGMAYRDYSEYGRMKVKERIAQQGNSWEEELAEQQNNK